MAGPGGGSNGGGGHGGGRSSSGGSSHHSGVRRPTGGYHHGGYHHHHHHGGYYRHNRYGSYGNGINLSGGCGLAAFGAIVLFLLAIWLIPMLFFDNVTYNERTFQDFANAEYKKAFGESTAYEDNILVVFLTTDNADEYYYIGWVGDHVNTEINYLFGNENTELGRAMNNSINNAGYWYSLDTNLASVVNTMTKEVENLKVEPFTCSENHKQVESKLVNYTDFEITEELINTALKDFTDKTNIPMVIVVEDRNDVF